MRRSVAFAYIVVVVALGLLILTSRGLDPSDHISILSFLFWVGLLAAVELLPVHLGLKIELTMGFVIILPVVILYPTPIAMAIVGLGSVDPRELRLEVPVHKALFNRAQSMIAAGAATIPFQVFELRQFSLLAIASAALIHLVVNLGLVAIDVRIARGATMPQVLRSLLPSPVSGFLMTYALLTGLSAATALIYTEGAGWAVAAILIPLLFARLSIIGARNQQELSERLRAQQDALMQVTDRIFTEREGERKRIAADIHDSSLQLLAAATYACGNAKDAVARGEIDAARSLIETAQIAIDSATSSLRESLVDLRRSSVEQGGLMETIHKFASDVATLWGSDVRIEGDIEHEPPVPVALAAFQILQESLTNALKHSGSDFVTVRVSENDGMVHLVVEDDGVGFDPSQVASEEHVGMQLMKERAASLGGRVELESDPGRGTRLEAVLPAGAGV